MTAELLEARDLCFAYNAGRPAIRQACLSVKRGTVAAKPAKAGYMTINKEALVSLDPEVILDIVHTPGGRLSEDSETVWNEMARLRAVRERRVHAIRNEFILHTSQFVSQTVRLLAEIMHPEAFRGDSK